MKLRSRWLLMFFMSVCSLKRCTPFLCTCLCAGKNFELAGILSSRVVYSHNLFIRWRPFYWHFFSLHRVWSAQGFAKKLLNMTPESTSNLFVSFRKRKGRFKDYQSSSCMIIRFPSAPSAQFLTQPFNFSSSTLLLRRSSCATITFSKWIFRTSLRYI